MNPSEFMLDKLLTVKDVSDWLKIRPSTLYLWAAQGKIPCRRIHTLIRFEKDTIQHWLQSFSHPNKQPLPLHLYKQDVGDVESIIAVAKRDVYTPRLGGTITPSPMGKEEENGTR